MPELAVRLVRAVGEVCGALTRGAGRLCNPWELRSRHAEAEPRGEQNRVSSILYPGERGGCFIHKVSAAGLLVRVQTVLLTEAATRRAALLR